MFGFWKKSKEPVVPLEYRIDALERRCELLHRRINNWENGPIPAALPKGQYYVQAFTLPWAKGEVFMGRPMVTPEAARNKSACGIHHEATLYGKPIGIQLGETDGQ